MMHFNTAFRKVTNFLPTLVWNGLQPRTSLYGVTFLPMRKLIAYWKGHGFKEVGTG